MNSPSPLPEVPNLATNFAVGREFLDAVVAPVGDEYVAVGGLGDSPREVELPVTVAKAAPLVDELAVLGELLYAVIAMIDQQQVVVLVE